LFAVSKGLFIEGLCGSEAVAGWVRGGVIDTTAVSQSVSGCHRRRQDAAVLLPHHRRRPRWAVQLTV